MNRYWKSALVVLACTLLFTAPAYANQKPETPETIDGVPTVSAEEAKKLIDGGAIPIDCRKKIEYAEEHIQTAIHVPYKEKSERVADFDAAKDRFDIESVIGDKNTPIVLYCNGVKCWKSYKASVLAQRKGYTKVYRLREGIPAWKKKPFQLNRGW